MVGAMPSQAPPSPQPVPPPPAPAPPANSSPGPVVVEGGKSPPPVRGPGRAGPSLGKQSTGSVGSMIPLLGAEAVNPSPEPAPPAAGSGPGKRLSGNVQ